MIEVFHLTTSSDAMNDQDVAKLYFDVVSNGDLNAIQSIFESPEDLRKKGIHYRLVAQIDIDDKEKAFELTNHIDGPWTSNDGVKVMAEKVRSTSVGDVMIKNSSEYFYVAPFGFKRFNSNNQ